MMDVGKKRVWPLRVTVVVVAGVAALVAWVSNGDEGGSEEPSPPGKARIVSDVELIEVAALSGEPMYWAGPMPGMELELSAAGVSGSRVRYLPKGSAPGSEGDGPLTIGTYPLVDPAAALDRFARRKDAIVKRAGGLKAVTTRSRPTSVYLADSDNEVQIEVYDPSPRRAMSLALSGQVVPVGG